MAEQTGEVTAQGVEAAQAQGADPAVPADAQGATPPDEGLSVEALQRKVTELEKDNRSYRQAAKQREAAEKAKTEAEMSESERLASRVEELERQLTDREQRAREQSLRLASMTSAQRLGYRNPDIAYRLLDTSAIEFGEDGTPTNVEQMLTALAKSDPYLLVATDFGGGQRGASAAQGTDMNTLIRRAAGRP
jgi:predicted RNase H-like nuclease (RuvC/YqgF family)